MEFTYCSSKDSVCARFPRFQGLFHAAPASVGTDVPRNGVVLESSAGVVERETDNQQG